MSGSSCPFAERGVGRRRGFVSSVLLFGTASLMAGLTDACVQVDLVSIANTNGQITDYQSKQDELSVWIGVDEDILFTWKNNMEPWQQYDFRPGFITVPCFNEGVFYIETTEIDEAISDKTQVMIACKNL